MATTRMTTAKRNKEGARGMHTRHSWRKVFGGMMARLCCRKCGGWSKGGDEGKCKA